ncbi:MarR family winged helix-turn-helix transcriptional regulator [Massilia sp. YIM B04103]|uniref:MarR family winged helix-turn-helix transcriptional regulator n=1 Tax=Massilia sp. YIM B04103 TaxID=2963106 RepID=UPI00210CF816|nr:MarR family transcriptional regulator [Massilia sp. YIM B04103]
MRTPPTAPLEDQLCFSLYRANLEIGRAYQPLFDTLGITYPQFLVLNSLWEKDGRSVGEIAERLSLESSNITPLIKRLEASGLLTRQRNPLDDRQVLVTLSEAGRALRQRCTLTEVLLGATGMKPEQLTALNAAIQRLLRAIDSTKEKSAQSG